MSLKCEEVRERFSALWENELSPSEEPEVRTHLERCLECRAEFARFEKTLQMVHSVEEVEVPEEFLSGIYEKLDGRKKQDLSPEKIRGQRVALRWKLPVQAVAMVGIVFLAFYLTKMMPNDSLRMKAVKEAKPPSSLEEKGEKEVVEGVKTPEIKKEESDRRLADESPARVARKDVSDRPQKRAQSEKPDKGSRVAAGETAGSVTQAPQPAPDAPPVPPPQAAGARHSAPLDVEREESVVAKKKDSLEPAPSEEIILKSSDRKKGISQVGELAKRLGGETLAAEGNVLLISLPSSALSGFRRELEGIGTRASNEEAGQQGAGVTGIRAERPAKGGEYREKDKQVYRLDAVKEARVVIRLVLVEE